MFRRNSNSSLGCGSWASFGGGDGDEREKVVASTCPGMQENISVTASVVSASASDEANASKLDNLEPSFPSSKTSTFKPNFRVHSRHRSIAHLNELALLTAPKPAFEAKSSSEVEQPVVNFTSSNHSPFSIRVKQISDCNNTNKQENVNYTCGALEKRRIENHQQHQLEEHKKEEDKMSQTIQSIQSLSMQLNRAASMQGYLDDISNIAPHQSQLDYTDTHEPKNFVTTSSSKLSRLVSKKAVRVKEMLLQNLGKADKTCDELFQIYEENFYKQQTHALKLQKEFKNYVNSLTGIQEASKSLNSSIKQATGEYQSPRHDLVCDNLSQLEHLNEDLLDKLRSQVLINLNEYLSQFNELRDKIAKRRRKLIDYDSSKRVYELMLANVNKKRLLNQQKQNQLSGNSSTQATTGGRSTFKSALTLGLRTQDDSDSIQSATSQLMDEARLLKLREQYNYCKVMYETINGELHEELPIIYEKKMKNLLLSLQNYFSLEAQFHLNAGKLFATAGDVVDELPMSIRSKQQTNCQRNLMNRSPSNSIPTPGEGGTDVLEYSKACSSSGMGSSRGESSHESSSRSTSSIDATSDGNGSPTSDEERAVVVDDNEIEAEIGVTAEKEEIEQVDNIAIDSQISKMSGIIDTSIGKELKVDEVQKKQQISPMVKSKLSTVEENSSNRQDENQFKETVETNEEEIHKVEEESTSGAEKELGLKKNHIDQFLYKVKTSYKYLAEDVDELCFEADEIIQVVKFEEGIEQEDGWLVGIREVNGQRGLFPANFTRPI